MLNCSVLVTTPGSCWKKLTSILLSIFITCPLQVFAAPTGGQVVSGTASIIQSGTTTDINQSTNKAIINWQGFSISSNETVNFNQPSVYSMTLNRVIGNEKSIIAGALNATGKVYIVNANGILFTKDASINVGGLVASTLNITNDDFLKGNYVFQGTGQSGEVINMGVIKATGNGTSGGYVALLGDQVKNEGIIIAERGTVSLNGAQKVTLNFNGDSLVNVSLDEGSLTALVENKKAIIADGGKVILTAKAANDLVSSQVNVSGIVQAQTLADLTGGSIEVYAHGGTATVSGTLDASAPSGGNGGSIETSGKSVKIADTATITTASAKGKTGTWTIDPDGFTIASYGGDITGATLGKQLASNNVTIYSTQGTGSDGGIAVNDTVAWSANTLLTLNATKAITVNGTLSPTGTSGGIVFIAGTDIYINTPLSLASASLNATAGGSIYLAGALSWTGNQTVSLTAAEDLKLYSTLTGGNGTLNLTATSGSVDIDGATSLGATTVNVTAGTDVNLNAAVTWTGDTTATLTAGNDININAPLTATGTNAGLVMNYGDDYNIWTSASYSGAVLNSDGIPVAQTAPDDAVYGSITLSGDNASLTMNGIRYTLIHSMSELSSSYKLMDSTGSYYWNPETQSYDIAKTIASTSTCASSGGTCWWNTTTKMYDILDQDPSTGKYYSVSSGRYSNTKSNATNSKYAYYYYDVSTASYDLRTDYSGLGYYYNVATGLYDLVGSGYYALAQNIDASNTTYDNCVLLYFGGTLAGLGHTIDKLTISAASTDSIGLIGTALTSSVLRDIGLTNTDIEGKNYVGALVGYAPDALTVTGSYSTGSVKGTSQVGGLIGKIAGNLSVASTISSCYSSADVSANAVGTDLGGLIGSFTTGSITHAHATGTVTGNSGYVGGLVGTINAGYGSTLTSEVNLSYATGKVENIGTPASKSTSYSAGGLVGYAMGSGTKVQITNSFATGDVSGYAIVGGLIGYGVSANIDNTYHTTGTVTSSGYHFVSASNEWSSATGGLAGFLTQTDVANSFSTGNVISTFDSTLAPADVANGSDNRTSAGGIGGLIGLFTGSVGNYRSTVSNSFATGNVIATSKSNSVGGLIGNVNWGSVVDCWANTTVTGGNNVGGLIGKAYSQRSSATSDTVYITNSTSYGTVSGVNYVGGIVGYASTHMFGAGTVDTYSGAWITGSTSYTNVTGENYVGGIAGWGNVIVNSTASGTVTGTGTYTGSIYGSMYSETMSVTTGNSYSASTSYTVPTTPTTTSVTGTSPGETAATTATDATSAAAANASSVISNIQSQAAAAAYVARMETISQVTEVANGQQLSVSQSAPTNKDVVRADTKEVSLAEAIRNFSNDSETAGNTGGRGASYSAGIKTVTADGVTYIVDDNNAGNDENTRNKKAPAKTGE